MAQDTNPDLTPEEVGDGRQFSRLMARLKPQAKLWLRRCRCEKDIDGETCTCRIMHPGRGDICALCSNDDHYPGLDGYLELIAARQRA